MFPSSLTVFFYDMLVVGTLLMLKLLYVNNFVSLEKGHYCLIPEWSYVFCLFFDF